MAGGAPGPAYNPVWVPDVRSSGGLAPIGGFALGTADTFNGPGNFPLNQLIAGPGERGDGTGRNNVSSNPDQSTNGNHSNGTGSGNGDSDDEPSVPDGPDTPAPPLKDPDPPDTDPELIPEDPGSSDPGSPVIDDPESDDVTESQEVPTVPEPGTVFLLGTGLAVAAFHRLRSRPRR